MSFNFPPLGGTSPQIAPDIPSSTGGDSSPERIALSGSVPRSFIPGFLPDGQKLQLTIAVKALYLELCAADGVNAPGRPCSLADALALLFLSANHPDVWNAPRPAPNGGLLLPLRVDSYALMSAIDGWAEKHFAACESMECLSLSQGLWDEAHSGMVVPIGKKKNGTDDAALAPPYSNQLCWILAGGDLQKWDEIRYFAPLHRVHEALHCWYAEKGIEVSTPARLAAEESEINDKIEDTLRKLDRK